MMENTSECSLCLDPFKDPRILSCIHTFCHDCLDLYVSTYKRSDNSGDKFDCPVCRTTITLPDSGVAGLQKNFYLNQDPKLDHPLCALHSREDLRFYCRECKEAICRDCKVVSHNGHAIDMADSVATELREELKELINETEKTINENEIRQRSVIETGQGSLETTLAIIEINAGMMKKEIDRLLQFTQNLLLPDIKSKKKKAFFLQTSYEIKHGKLAEFKNLFSDADRKGGNVFKVYKEIMHKLPEINELKEAPLSFDTECNNEDCLDYTKLVNEFDLLRNDLRQQATKFTNTEFNIKRTEHTDIEKASSGKRAQSPKPCPARGKKWRRSDVGIVSQEGKNRVEMSFEKGQCSDILPTPGPSRQRQLFSGSGILINSQPSCSTSHPQQKSYLSSATTDKPQKCNRASETCTAVSSEPKSGKQSSGKLVDLNSPLDIPNKSDVPTNSPVILEGARVMLKGGGKFEEGETYMVRHKNGGERKMIWTLGNLVEESLRFPTTMGLANENLGINLSCEGYYQSKEILLLFGDLLPFKIRRLTTVNPIALRMAITQWSFGHSQRIRVN